MTRAIDHHRASMRSELRRILTNRALAAAEQHSVGTDITERELQRRLTANQNAVRRGAWHVSPWDAFDDIVDLEAERKLRTWENLK